MTVPRRTARRCLCLGLLVSSLLQPAQVQEPLSAADEAPNKQASDDPAAPASSWKHQAWNKALERGQALEEEGRYVQAEDALVQALKQAERFGLSDPRVAACLNGLAHFYQSRGNRDAAEPLYLRTIKILESSLGPAHIETGNAWLNLAEFYRGADRFSEAEPAYARWLHSLETSFAANQASLISPIRSLALIYYLEGHFERSSQLLERSLSIAEDSFGARHAQTADCLNDLGVVYAAGGRSAEAERILRRAARIREEILGPNDLAVARTLSHLGEAGGECGPGV